MRSDCSIIIEQGRTSVCPLLCSAMSHFNRTMRTAPIKGIKPFSEAMRFGRRFHSPEGMMTVRRSSQPTDTLFYGLIVRKKLARTSVMRYRIKRLLRESIRQWSAAPPEGAEYIQSIIVGWNSIPPHPMRIALQDIQPIVAQMLNDAVAYFNKKRQEKLQSLQGSP